MRSRWLNAVSRSTATWWRDVISRAARRPSIPGILTSRMARSGWCSSTSVHRLVAAAGLPHDLVAGRDQDLLEVEAHDGLVLGDDHAGQASSFVSPSVMRRPSPPSRARGHGGQELVLAVLEVDDGLLQRLAGPHHGVGVTRRLVVLLGGQRRLRDQGAHPGLVGRLLTTTANCSSSTASSSRARTSRAWTSLIRRSSRARCMERQVYVAGNQRRRASQLGRAPPRRASVPDPGSGRAPGPSRRTAAGYPHGSTREVVRRVAEVADQARRVLAQPGRQGQVGRPSRVPPRRSRRRRPARRRRRTRRGRPRVARTPPSRPGFRQAMAQEPLRSASSDPAGRRQRLVEADRDGRSGAPARRGRRGRPAAAAARCTARRNRPGGCSTATSSALGAEGAVGVDLEHEVGVVGPHGAHRLDLPTGLDLEADPG